MTGCKKKLSPNNSISMISSHKICSVRKTVEFNKLHKWTNFSCEPQFDFWRNNFLLDFIHF